MVASRFDFCSNIYNLWTISWIAFLIQALNGFVMNEFSLILILVIASGFVFMNVLFAFTQLYFDQKIRKENEIKKQHWENYKKNPHKYRLYREILDRAEDNKDG